MNGGFRIQGLGSGWGDVVSRKRLGKLVLEGNGGLKRWTPKQWLVKR